MSSRRVYPKVSGLSR